MVKVVDIKEIPDRFIDRNRLEEIKNRIQRLPQGDYKFESSIKEVVCYLKDQEGRIVGTKEIFQEPLYPGLVDLLINLKNDMESLITHVENADIENDILTKKLDEIQCLGLQQEQKK